ncbi:MAG: RNA methyltransferase [Candidatus Omnitrophica bacterium]|nr:RNA methyltransferase [Candidatus Omnitrophota bacterium]
MKTLQKLSHQQIVKRQEKRLKQPRIPACVVLNNIRSLYNVGSIFRTADGAGFEKIWLCGITGTPPNAMISKTALGAEEVVDWEQRNSASELIEDLKAQGYKIFVLEQADTSISFEKIKAYGPVCLVLGNEIEGVSEDVANLCDQAVEIEMSGIKNSLNVSVAFGIMAYQIRNCLKS